MKIFESYTLGDLTLSNKIVMAPMTRSRALQNTPNALMRTYYAQRAGAGLIITEGTSPSINGLGYPRIPGAYTAAQLDGWKAIAEGVHESGGKIFVQLMHTGRVTASLNLPEGGKTLAPSAVPLTEGEMYTDTAGMQPHDSPIAMTQEDIEIAQQEFVNAAKGLVNAGIDGIELHSANGYLLDQFLNPKTNIRTDNYGGNYKNRARFVLETARKVVHAVGENKVGIRFSPYGVFNDMMGDFEDLVDMYTYIAQELAKLNIAYIHIVDQRVAMNAPEFATDIRQTIREHFSNTLIVGGDINSAQGAEALLSEGYDLAYIGRPFIANPNLVAKLKAKEPLTQPNFDLLYTPDEKGYTDYT